MAVINPRGSEDSNIDADMDPKIHCSSESFLASECDESHGFPDFSLPSKAFAAGVSITVLLDTLEAFLSFTSTVDKICECSLQLGCSWSVVVWSTLTELAARAASIGSRVHGISLPGVPHDTISGVIDPVSPAILVAPSGACSRRLECFSQSRFPIVDDGLSSLVVSNLATVMRERQCLPQNLVSSLNLHGSLSSL